MSTGSIVVRRSLGRQLKAARLAAGKTAADVQVAGIASKTKLARIESGMVSVRVADARTLGWLYGVDEATTETWVEMARNTAAEGWWADYNDVLPSWIRIYVELEAVASELLAWDSELVLGLLQIPDYTRALCAAELRVTPETAEHSVKLRADRQERAFRREQGLKITSVLGPGALAREVGGPAVMQRQKEALLAHEREGRAQIRVLPWAVGAHAAVHGSFVILKFDSDDHPDVVYLETRAGSRYVTEADLVADYHAVFEAVRQESVPIEEAMG